MALRLVWLGLLVGADKASKVLHGSASVRLDGRPQEFRVGASRMWELCSGCSAMLFHNPRRDPWLFALGARLMGWKVAGPRLLCPTCADPEPVPDALSSEAPHA
jgi:hypothetical protein